MPQPHGESEPLSPPALASRDRLASLQNASPIRVIPHTRPLLFHEGRLYCARFDRIVSTSDYGTSFQDETTLDLPMKSRPILRLFPLAQRIVRASTYRMRVLPDGSRVFIFRGGVYTQRPGEPTARRTYVVERGSRPVSLAVSRDGLVVFGEYFDNAERGPIRIFASRDSGQTWGPVYTFPAGEVRHVHGISYDPWEDCFWICAGDYGPENQLLRASTDFRDLRMLRQGGQGNRFYYLLVTENHLVTATDTPLEDNHICVIDKHTGELEQVARIENTSFYSCWVGGKIFLSTNAEPSPVNDTEASHVWMGDLEGGGWRRILTFPGDFFHRLTHLPGVHSGLFQYPRIFFPEGENPGRELVCYGLGVRGYDDAMLCFDPTVWSA